MPDPQTPSTVFGGDNMMGGGTNEAMPQFGGIANPGESIHISVDGNEHIIQPDENGMWDFNTPELSNGDHEFEMWSENATGDRSDSVEWDSSVSATENDREWQRARNEQWDETGKHEWREQNEGTPTPASAGGGGGQQEGEGEGAGDGGQSTGGSGGSGAGGSGGGGTGTPVAGVEKGNQPGVRVMG